MAGFDAILLTCEHGGNRVPARYRAAFAGHHDLLNSHRGYDEGALEVARELRRRTGAVLIASTVTRLLVDLNRPEIERSVFSRVTRPWPPAERERLLEVHHRPHWRKVFAQVESECEAGKRLLHLACHTFTPVFDGRVRRTDVALLYDPRRRAEADLCTAWAKELARALPGLRVHRNQPYRGWSPGLTTSLRRRWGARRYLGVEIEVGQGLSADDRRRVREALLPALERASGQRAASWPAGHRRQRRGT